MLLLYDGQCLMCNRLIRYLLETDKNDQLRVAALQHYMASDQGQKVAVRDDVDTVILVDDHRVYYKSTAVLRVGRKVSSLSFLYALGFLFPRVVRDAVYDFIARHRYRWFGRASECLLPDTRLKHKYLTSAEELESFFEHTV